jgi:hypothetical protein
VQSTVLLTALLIASILILMTEKWATELSCIHIEITSCKIPSLGTLPKSNFYLTKRLPYLVNLLEAGQFTITCYPPIPMVYFIG